MSPLGKSQCENLRDALASLSLQRCFVSPMRRCLETREIVAPTTAFEVDAALREVAFGDWEGRTLDWLEAHDADRLAQRRRDPVNFRPPGGESFADVALRLPLLLERLKSEPGALVIGHRGTLGVLERLLRGLPLSSQDVKPLEPAEFRVISDG